MVKCDSGITPLNKTAAYDVEVDHYLSLIHLSIIIVIILMNPFIYRKSSHDQVEQLSIVKRQAEFPENFREE